MYLNAGRRVLGSNQAKSRSVAAILVKVSDGESMIRVGRLQPVITKAAPNFRGVGIFISDVISESGTEQTAKFAAI